MAVVEIRVPASRALLDYIDLFEAELNRHKLRLELKEENSHFGRIRMLVDVPTDEEEKLVRELATLFFGSAYEA